LTGAVRQYSERQERSYTLYSAAEVSMTWGMSISRGASLGLPYGILPSLDYKKWKASLVRVSRRST
jgi:hypothetical protein